MKTILLIAILAVIAWYGLYQPQNIQVPPVEASGPYTKSVEYAKCTTADGRVFYGQPPAGTTCTTTENITNDITISRSENVISAKSALEPAPTPTREPVNDLYQCDGRQYCSQMNSRAEAEFFLKNCPNPKMDGDNDGIPCENDSRF